MGDDGVQLQFFQKRRRIAIPRRLEGQVPSVDFPNVDGFVGAIIGERQAKLRELKTSLTLEEAMDIYEVIVVGRINEMLALEHAQRGKK